MQVWRDGANFQELLVKDTEVFKMVNGALRSINISIMINFSPPRQRDF
jgi:hypothetical protein